MTRENKVKNIKNVYNRRSLRGRTEIKIFLNTEKKKRGKKGKSVQ